MERQLLYPTNLRVSTSTSLTGATYWTTFYSEHTHKPNPTIRCLRLSKRSSDPFLTKEQKNLSQLLRTDAAVRNIERKANSKKYNNLWPKAVLEALDEAIAANLWETALKIFGLLRKQHWYEPRCQTYTKLLMMLGKCRQPEQASLLFELMLSDGLKPTVDVYTALVSVYGKSGLLDKAFSTVDDMKSVSDCKPDVYTYSILINSCTKFNRPDLIERVLAEMSYLGIGCNTVIYNTLIDGYGKAEMFELMEETLTNMIESGSCLPDVFTFNSFLSAYGNCGQIERMEKWYDEFQLMGIRPDPKTFNILIKSYGKARMYEKMRSVMEFMKKSAYSKAGSISKVDSISRQVENSDVMLDTPFFNCIISAYCRAGDLRKVSELFLAMKEKKCVPDHITFATMIQAYNELGMNEAAQDLKNRMITTKENSGTRLIGC
ncbi:hypothetical protein ACFX2C_028592 [Malus domestica]